MKFSFLSCQFVTLIAIIVSIDSIQASTIESKGVELTPYQRVSMYLGHSLFKADPVERQSEMLWGIKSVNPVLEISSDLEQDFDTEKVEQKIIAVLQKKGVIIDKENGYLLLFRIRGVWDKEKATLLYTYDLDLVDKIYISRDGQIKSNYRSVWNISNMGYAGKDVYYNAMLINVDSAIEQFAISFYEQLDYDIISDTPRLAKQTYQKIRDGQEDILKLLEKQKLGE